MGTAYARVVLGVPEPKVGLLSIGEEETKGNELTREAHQLLRGSRLRFIGNVEARFIKQRLVLTTAKGLAKVTGFQPTVDLVERSEGAKAVAIGAGGTAITFAKAFHQVPRVAVTVDGTSALIGTKESVTAAGFTAHVFNSGGAEVGGTVDWDARGA